MSSCVKLDDTDCTTHALERLVAYYPKPEYWQNLLYSMFQQQGQTDKSLLQVYRLASEVDVLKRADDYTEMAQLAIEAGSPGEAATILEKGLAEEGLHRRARAGQEQAPARLGQEAGGQPTRRASTRSLRMPPPRKTGDKDVGVGLAYLGYKEYAKAVDGPRARASASPACRTRPKPACCSASRSSAPARRRRRRRPSRP